MSDGTDAEQTPPAPAEAADEGKGEDRRPRLLPVWILLGAAVLSGGAWAVSERLGGGPPPDEAQVPLITASAEPWKVRPDDPGGMEIPNRGTLIYETLTTADPEEAPERILPPPEEPLSPPEPEPAPADELAEATPGAGSEAEALPPAEEAPLTVEEAPLPEPETAAADPVQEAAPQEPATQDDSDIVLPPPPKPRPLELALADAVQPADAALQEQQTPAAAEAAGQPAPDALAASLQAEDANPVPVPADKPMRVARAGGAGESAAAAPREHSPSTAAKWRYVQLGTASARAPLEAHWEMLRRRHDDALIGLSPLIMPVDRGEQGIMYRLRAGPLSDEEMAWWVCARLKERGLECFVPRD